MFRLSVASTIVPMALFTGMLLRSSARMAMRSAYLPGVSVPIWSPSPTASAAWRVVKARTSRWLISAGASLLAAIFARLGQHALGGQRRAHLGEHVAGEADLDVAAEARADAVVERGLDHRHAAAEPELLLGGGGERDLGSRLGDQAPALLRHVVAVDQRQVGSEQAGPAELDDLVAALAHHRVHGDAEAVLAGEGEEVGHRHDAAHVDEHADRGQRVRARAVDVAEPDQILAADAPPTRR